MITVLLLALISGLAAYALVAIMGLRHRLLGAVFAFLVVLVSYVVGQIW